jgi:hypothetical protein
MTMSAAASAASRAPATSPTCTITTTPASRARSIDPRWTPHENDTNPALVEHDAEALLLVEVQDEVHAELTAD